MKKYFLFLSLFLLSVSGFSQGIRFTVFGEPQLCWFAPDSKTMESAGSMIGFNGGLNFDNFFTENYAFSTGVSINNVNGKLKYLESTNIKGLDSLYALSSADVATYHLQYIQIPIGLKFKTIEIGYSRIFAHLGMNAGINIQSKGDLPQVKDVDAADVFHWYNVGYYIGGGLEYSLGGNTAIVGGLTYKQGLLDITEVESRKLKTGALSLRVGILF